MLLGRARSLRYLFPWPPAMEIEDVVSSTLVRALSRIDECRGETRPQRAAWLLSLLNSEVVDSLRRHGAEKRGGGRTRSFEDFITESQSQFENFFAANLSTVSSRLQKEELLQATYEAIEVLPPRQRQAVLARFIGGWAIDDIATHMSEGGEPVTTKAVTGMIERALVKLRDLLNRLGEP